MLPGVLVMLAIISGCPPQLQGPAQDDGVRSPPDLTTPVSYGKDIQPIYDKNCNYCHRVGGVAERFAGIPMSLSSGESYGDTVNQPSARLTDWQLVVPHRPEDSLLYQKVASDHPPYGFRMPLFDQPLLGAEIELIRRWIEAGAPAN